MTQESLQNKILEWLKSKNSQLQDNEIQTLPHIFKYIRNIPFKILLKDLDYQKSILYTLSHNCGSCSTKHFLLGFILEQKDISTKYVVYPFYWKDLKVDYPERIRNLSLNLPLTYHLALKADLGYGNKLIDATWDPPLKSSGFPVNYVNNGIIETKNAVVPLDEIVYNNAKDWVKNFNSERSLSDKKAIFYNELNQWLNKLRK